MKQSKLFTKTQKDISQDESSVNAQFLLRGGFVNRLTAGVYSYLPLGLRVLQKIENIIREEMNILGAQEILMPALHPRENWDRTGRWDVVDVLFKLNGAGDKEYALGATHEEVVTPLLQKSINSYKDLPQAVYQIQTKFRNEARAKSGILRGREFRMKDLYSFHTNQEDLDKYYEIVHTAYNRIYDRCGIGPMTYYTYASGGAFSKFSHEFQTITPAGEDLIYLCRKCNVALNKEIIEEIGKKCPECSDENLSEEKAIEVGNIFKLGTKFSDAFDFSFQNENDVAERVVMGCYGIGPSRVMGTIVEVHHDDKGIIWPANIAPYSVHLVSLCREEKDIAAVEELYQMMTKNGVEVLYDDRDGVRAGEKFADSDLIGIPVRLVVSPKTLEKLSVEVKKRNETEATLVELENLETYLKSLI
jgi:prolyl-tRNA synthetase